MNENALNDNAVEAKTFQNKLGGPEGYAGQYAAAFSVAPVEAGPSQIDQLNEQK